MKPHTTRAILKGKIRTLAEAAPFPLWMFFAAESANLILLAVRNSDMCLIVA